VYDTTTSRFAKTSKRPGIDAEQARLAGYRVVRIPPFVDIIDGGRPGGRARARHSHFVQQREAMFVGIQHFCGCIVRHCPNYKQPGYEKKSHMSYPVSPAPSLTQ
jgi:hypothetical protein